MTRRNWAFDITFAAALSLTAILTSLGSTREPQFYPSTWDRVGPQPPAPPPIEVYESISDGEQLRWSVLMLLISIPLVFRRRHPLAMLLTNLVLAGLAEDDHASLRLSFLICIVLAYSAAVYSPYRFPALAGLGLAAVVYMRLQGSEVDAVPTISRDSMSFVVLLPIAVAADGLRRWKLRMEQERDRAATLELERAALLHQAAEATARERARIARELHDVVTHNVSVMVIQAGAARKVLHKQPDQAEQALLAVEASGRSALTELRHVMGLLTVESEPELAPQPGLSRLEQLIEQVRNAGVDVHLTVRGHAAELPEGVQLTTYRVVQEGLTNAVKHATGAAASVVVEYATNGVTVEVSDTGGRARGPATEDAGGRGLIGLRERVAVYGGTVEAGPRLRGGFRVRAHIPLTEPV